MTDWHRIEPDPELAPGQRRGLEIGGREIVICRVAEGYFAVAGRCTHSAWPLANEPLEGHQIVCTLHGARFDVRDGCPVAGPASKPLATFPIEQRDGALYVSL